MPQSWDVKPERPATPQDLTVTLWRVDTDTALKEPGRTEGEGWPGCTVLAHTTRFMGRAVALVEANRISINALRAVRGVRTVEPAEDRRFLDDDTETVVIVSGEGTHWERVGA
jgi:hypothetical protein